MAENTAGVLFYTVGGTPNPIINAVNDHHSGGALKKAVFICSEPNPETV